MNRNYLFTALLFFCFSVIHANSLIRFSTTISIREGNSIALISAANPLQFQLSACAFTRYEYFEKSSFEVATSSCINVNAGSGNVDLSTNSKIVSISKFKSGIEIFKIKSQEEENINKLNK